MRNILFSISILLFMGCPGDKVCVENKTIQVSCSSCIDMEYGIGGIGNTCIKYQSYPCDKEICNKYAIEQ